MTEALLLTVFLLLWSGTFVARTAQAYFLEVFAPHLSPEEEAARRRAKYTA